MPTVILAAALFLAGMASPAPAVGQVSQCDTRTKVLGHLANKYQEAPVAIGVTSSGGLVEVLSTGDGNTWTIIMTSPQGMSCLIAAGEGWRGVPAVPVGPDT
jgi:hypothetical protein